MEKGKWTVRRSSENLAASSGESLSAVDAAWCVWDALWYMLCASMCWCPGCLVVCSIILCGIRLYLVLRFFHPRKLGYHHTLTKLILLVLPPPQAKLRFKILDASSLQYIISTETVVSCTRRSILYTHPVTRAMELSQTGYKAKV